MDAGHVWAIVRAGIGITDEGGREAYERLALEAAATESAGRMGRVAREIAAAVSPEDFAAEVRNAFAERMVRVYDLDGGMARNRYLQQVLADVTGRSIVVPSATDLTALGTARMAMRGLGVATLPELPPPASNVGPVGSYGPEARSRFAMAVTRARGWKQA